MLIEGSTWIDAEDPEATLMTCGGPVDAATAAAGDVVLWGDDDSVLACSAAALLATAEVELTAFAA